MTKIFERKQLANKFERQTAGIPCVFPYLLIYPKPLKSLLEYLQYLTRMLLLMNAPKLRYPGKDLRYSKCEQLLRYRILTEVPRLQTVM